MDINFQHNIPQDFTNNSKVWIYQSSRLFSIAEAFEIETMLSTFVAKWQSHGAAVKGYANLFFGQFIVMIADEANVTVGGCSTDSSVRVIKQIEETFSVNMFDRQSLAFIVKDKVQGFQARKIAFNLGLSGEAFKNCVKFVTNLYSAYLGLDCAMLEINPLFKTSDEKIIAVDCKMGLDENALMRHPDLAALRDVTEEDPTEVEAGQFNLNFVKLDGNVGCMVNGAGLAMATMDMIKLSGGEPANFLDVGGTANAQTVEAGFRIIMKDPNVKAILINIFGGIVRCDRVAAGVIEAYNKIGNIDIPIIVRLQGTNAIEAKKLIDESGLKVQSAVQLSEAADLVKAAVA